MQTRRKFLQNLTCVGVSAVAGAAIDDSGIEIFGGDSLSLAPTISTPPKLYKTFTTEEVDVRPGGILRRSEFREMLAESLNEAFESAYKEAIFGIDDSHQGFCDD